MAIVSVIFGGTFGLLLAAIFWLCGASGPLALAVWSGSGLLASAGVLAIALVPRRNIERSAETSLSVENA